MKIAIINQKGGVGKSTITVNLGYGLAASGKKTLILDLDPQAHSTVLYVPNVSQENTVNDLFSQRNFDISKAVRPAQLLKEIKGKAQGKEIPNLFILPSNIHLAATSESIISRTHREKILDRHLKPIRDRFDFILMDCPPTLGVLTVNAVFTADLILIPTSYSKYSLDGISDLFRSIAEVKESEAFNYRILRNMKDARITRTNEAIEGALAPFEENLMQTIIRRSEPINQAQMTNQPIHVFDSRSTGAADFNALTEEIIQYGKTA